MRIITDEQLPKHKDLIAHILANHGIIVSPTDTVLGILTDATDQIAISKIVQFKGRALDKPISVFVRNIAQIEAFALITSVTQKFISTLAPGPYTFVLKLNRRGIELFNTPIKSSKNTIGVRLIKHKIVDFLLAVSKAPLTATSANVSGFSPHTDVDSFLQHTQDILKQQKRLQDLDLIDLIIKEPLQSMRSLSSRKTPKPSTVLDLTEIPNIKILRGSTTSTLVNTAQKLGLTLE